MAHGPPICASCGVKTAVVEHHLYPPDEGRPDNLTIWLCRACDRQVRAMRVRNDPGAAGLAASRYAAADFFADIKPALLECLAAGITQPRAIARALNERGIQARRGGTWGRSQVAALLRRLKAAGDGSQN